MSTAVEDAQPEPVPSTTQEKPTKMDEDTPAPKTENGDVNVDAKDTKKNCAEKKGKNGVRTYEDGVLKTSAREDLNDKTKNSKYDPSILPETDDPKLIRNQVEFYFSDSNLPQDKFLWDATDGTNNLPVKIEKICTFGRMKRFTPISAVVAALRASQFLDVTGPEGLEEVKRKAAYDPNIPRSKSESRSIYAKGFGDEEASSQFDIEAFFAPYGPTNSVRLRRTPEKLFKGSVFVEFQDDATSDAFLALDPKPLWQGKLPLKIMSKKQYQDEKEQEIKDGKIQPGPSYGARGRGRGRGGRGGNRGRNDRDHRGGRDRGDRDPDDWKRRREDDRANGFKDDRNRRDNKGGRGRGRRDDRGPRTNDRNRERDDREEKNGDDFEKVDSKANVPADEPKAENKKRAREDDDAKAVPAKKIDSKSDPVPEAPKVENVKKRAREDDGEEGTPAKKVDSKPEAATET